MKSCSFFLRGWYAVCEVIGAARTVTGSMHLVEFVARQTRLADQENIEGSMQCSRDFKSDRHATPG